MARRGLIGTALAAVTIGGVLVVGAAGPAAPAVVRTSMVLVAAPLPPMPEPPPRTGTPAQPPAVPPVDPSPAPAVGGPSPGPYEYESACLSAGNAGMGSGAWESYTCTGGYGAWYVRPGQ